MFWHLFSYRFKILFKSVGLLFWTMIFPILLGLLFKAAFSNLDAIGNLETSPVGIVTLRSDSSEFTALLREIKSGDTPLFDVTQISKTEAEQQLAADEIEGYYLVDGDDIELVAGKNGVPQAILLEVLNQYLQTQTKVSQLLVAGVPMNEIANELSITTNFMDEEPQASFSQSNFYFFTLLGMTIMNGLIWGLGNTADQQANQSPNGIRICLSPLNKFIVSFANLLASFIVFFAQVLIVVAVFTFVYGVDFGTHWNWIFALLSVSVLNALTFGTLMGNLLANLTMNQKISIGTILTTAMSVLAGMMGTQGIQYWISQHLPLLGRINLVNLISESFYQLYYYQSLEPFFINFIWLSGFTVVFFLISAIFERRVSFDHL